MRRHILTGFMAGELDPHIDGRIDTDQYAFGLSVCENFVAINEGPLVKRQGFVFVAPAAATASWLTAFRASVDQEYTLEWSNNRVRFYTNGLRIESSPGVAYEVTHPFSAAQAPFVSAQQSFDRQYLAHPSHPPSALRRDTPVTFTFETIGLEGGPFLDTNADPARTVTTNAVTGSVTITGNAGFTPAHVGALFRIEAKDFADIAQWEPGMTGVTVGQLVRNRGKVYEALTAGTTGSVEPEHTEGAFFDGMLESDLLNSKGPYGIKWAYLHDRFGVLRITAVTSATSATATVLRRLPNSVTTVPTDKWAHAAFSAAAGWPNLVALFDGRLIYIKEFDVIGSVAGDFSGGRVNFSAFTDAGRIEADLGFRRVLATDNPPLWVSADRRLLVGTASVEMAIGPASSGAAFSGTNILSETQSYYGSEAVFPVTIGTETLFLERGGRRVRSADYDFGRDRYDARDLNATSRHITASGIRQLAFQRVPHAFVFGVRGDGQLVCHAKTRSEIFGWTRWKLGGDARVLSAVSVVGADARTDELWVLIERVNGTGATVREVWRQLPWRELGDPVGEAFYVDGGVRFAMNGGATSVSVPHLAGQDVAVLVNGVVVPNLTVDAGGALDLPGDVIPDDPFTVIVGLPYCATATSMRPELRDGKGSTAGLRQRVTKSIARVLETLGLKVAAQGAPPEELILRRGGQLMDRQVPLYSGDTDGLVDAAFDREGRISWISDKPLPATITLAVQNMEVSMADA